MCVCFPYFSVYISFSEKEKVTKKKKRGHRGKGELIVFMSAPYKGYILPDLDFQRNWIHYDCLSGRSFSSVPSFHLGTVDWQI